MQIQTTAVRLSVIRVDRRHPRFFMSFWPPVTRVLDSFIKFRSIRNSRLLLALRQGLAAGPSELVNFSTDNENPDAHRENS
jgi:hypothetical protein